MSLTQDQLGVVCQLAESHRAEQQGSAEAAETLSGDRLRRNQEYGQTAGKIADALEGIIKEREELLMDRDRLNRLLRVLGCSGKSARPNRIAQG